MIPCKQGQSRNTMRKKIIETKDLIPKKTFIDPEVLRLVAQNFLYLDASKISDNTFNKIIYPIVLDYVEFYRMYGYRRQATRWRT